MSIKRKKVSVEPKENRASAGRLDFAKIKEDEKRKNKKEKNMKKKESSEEEEEEEEVVKEEEEVVLKGEKWKEIADTCGEFFELPDLCSLHREIYAGVGRKGISKSPFFLTESFASLFRLFQSKIKEEEKRKPGEFAERPILVQGCHGVGKSTNVYALASWIYANAGRVMDDDEILYLLYIPVETLVDMSRDQESAFFFYVLNLFYCLNQDLLEDEEDEYHISKWKKVGSSDPIYFNDSSEYKPGVDIDNEIVEMTNFLKRFMLDRCVAFIVDDSNYLFEKTTEDPKKVTKYFLKNFLSPKKYRNYTTVISGTSRSQYRQYVIDQRHKHLGDFRETWIHPIESNQLHIFISPPEKNSIYSKLQVGGKDQEAEKKKNLDLLAEVSGCIPFYLWYLAERSTYWSKRWKSEVILGELMKLIDNKCEPLLEKERIRVNAESFERFVNSMLFQTTFEDPRMVNVIDFGLVREKPGNEMNMYMAVNSYALSGLMIISYRNLLKSPPNRENFGHRTIEGIAFEKSLIAVLGSGFVFSLGKIQTCGSEIPNIPSFCVKSFLPISGIRKTTLDCGSISRGQCSMLVPKLSNFPYMDFFLVDRSREAKEGIKNATILCFQATVSDMFRHIYKGRDVQGFGEIGKFMLDREKLEDDEFDRKNGSLLLKLLGKVFGTETANFKVVKENTTANGYFNLKVYIKIGGGSWELMPNFHIVYLVKKEEIPRSNEVRVANCCFMGWKSIVEDFPKFFRLPNC